MSTAMVTTSKKRTRSSSRLYLWVENPTKHNNLGPLLRCAVAFGITTVVVVGFAKCNTEGSHGAFKYITIVAFPTASQAAAYLRSGDCKSNSNATVANGDFTTTGGTTRTQIVGLIGGVPNGYGQYSVNLDPNYMGGAREKHMDSSNSMDEDRVCRMDNDLVLPQEEDDDETTSTEKWRRISYPISDLDEHSPNPNLLKLVTQSPELATTDNDDDDDEVDNDDDDHILETSIVLAVSKHPCGLPYQLAKHCDWFLHIPHAAIPTARTTESIPPAAAAAAASSSSHFLERHPFLLDLPAALSIALHHISIHLGYQEGKFEGQKFQVVSERYEENHKDGDKEGKEAKQRRIERVQQKLQMQQTAETLLDDGGWGLFGDY